MIQIYPRLCDFSTIILIFLFGQLPNLCSADDYIVLPNPVIQFFTKSYSTRFVQESEDFRKMFGKDSDIGFSMLFATPCDNNWIIGYRGGIMSGNGAIPIDRVVQVNKRGIVIREMPNINDARIGIYEKMGLNHQFGILFVESEPGQTGNCISAWNMENSSNQDVIWSMKTSESEPYLYSKLYFIQKTETNEIMLYCERTAVDSVSKNEKMTKTLYKCDNGKIVLEDKLSTSQLETYHEVIMTNKNIKSLDQYGPPQIGSKP